MKTYIIAEAGVNHNGDIKLAKELIDVASSCGADVIKFQTFKAGSLATRQAAKADYQIETSGRSESQYEMLKKLELTNDMHIEIIKHCKKRNIEFFSTGFDIVSIDYLVSLGQDKIKVPSGEINNLPYLRHIGSLGKEVIMSTGMSTSQDISAAIEILSKAGMPINMLTVLHCTTEYPAPYSEVNLAAMNSIKKEFGVKVGYSDHTRGIEVAIAAVALGAKIIEKHFTLDRNLPGPDHQASLEPDELHKMIKSIRNIEIAIGNGVKHVTKTELKNRSIARKSLVAKKNIKSGDNFTIDNLEVKRPGNGISPMKWDQVIGTKAIRDFLEEEAIEV